MSIFNELQEQGIQQLLIRRLQMAGQSSPAPALAPEIFPTLEVEGERPEYAFLKGERLMSAQGTVAGVAGESTSFLLFNPIGSGQIATITKWHVEPAAASLVLGMVGAFTVPVGTGVAEVARDTRWQTGTGGLAGAGMLIAGVRSAPTSVVNHIVWAQTCPTTGSQEKDVPVILAPGFAFELRVNVLNTTLTRAHVQWYERPAGNGELR